MGTLTNAFQESRRCQVEAGSIGHSIPGRTQKRDLVQPNPMAGSVNKNQQSKLQRHGVTYPKSSFDGGVESGHFFGGNNLTVYETFDHGPRSLVHNEFGENQRRERNQKAHVGLDIAEKAKMAIAE